MSKKDTEKDKLQNTNSQKENQDKTNILLFNFSKIKQTAKIIVSDYNLFNYDFNIKSLLELNPKIEQNKQNDANQIKENTNLNLIKNLNIELPNPEKLSQENFRREFIDDYDASFANFCEIDKKIFIKAFVNKKYLPFLDKFGNIKISVKNLCDLLKYYSPSLKLKIKRRFIKKYKKKKLFRTMKSKSIKNLDFETLSGNNNSYNHIINNDGLRLISLKKNLKISVKKTNTNNIIHNNHLTNKENSQEGNINPNNNLIGNINILSNDCILTNNILKSSILNFQPPSNNIIQSNENFFNFSTNDQNIFNFNNNNSLNSQLTNNINNPLINKKKTFTPYTPFTPYINNNTPNTPNNNNIQALNLSNKKNNNNNQINFNLSNPLINYNNIVSPTLLSPFKDFLTPSSIQFSQGDLSSPYFNMTSDKFTFNNVRNSFVFNNLSNIGNQNQNLNLPSNIFI